ncbi:MAG: methyltransferase domain-containing protein [Alphaproteobacteria bacterium]|nr:methyltransferase domain-containing protein [Alphaproteobacteria bacterium]
MADGAAQARVAEDYYDSPDADTFYAAIWGGEDIHIGLYRSEGEPIAQASRRTVAEMARRLEPGGLDADTRVLDIGAGYGGAARYLARTYGACVSCLNLSEVENARNRALTGAEGLADKVAVRHGSFEDIPEPDAAFDIVWSQDAMLHSGNRRRVLAEVARVLRPGGRFIFTDPMQADDLADPGVLQPIYDRIHLSSLGSIAFYRAELGRLGFTELSVEPMPHELRTHYARVRAELARRRGELSGRISEAYIDRMLTGLQHWVDGADAGSLSWGILCFGKAA